MCNKDEDHVPEGNSGLSPEPEVCTRRRPVGPNGTPPQTVLEWFEENKLNYNMIRRLCRQPVRDTDPDLVWDSFQLPKEFEGVDLPPLESTPVPIESPSYYYSTIASKFRGYKSPDDRKAKIDLMDKLIEKCRNNEKARKLDFENRGIKCDDDSKYVDEFDLDSSFTMDLPPTPQTESKKRCKRQNNGNVDGDADGEFETNKRKNFIQNTAEASTPRSAKYPRLAQNSHAQIHDSELEVARPRPTRLVFSDNDFSIHNGADEMEWSDPDDEILSQVCLPDISPQNSFSVSADRVVAGEGFDDSDCDDILFSQLNY